MSGRQSERTKWQKSATIPFSYNHVDGKNMEDKEDKVVIITGASSGIGEAIAYHFASKGYKLSLIGRNKEELERVVEQCYCMGLAKEQVISLTGDLTDEDIRKILMDNTVNTFGRVDVLINNAGVLTTGMCSETSESEYRRVIETNQNTPYLLTQLAIPHLKQSKGNIINISSICGHRVTNLGLSAYSMSKAAVNMFTKFLALELARDGVRANCVSPGVVSTKFGRDKDGKMTDPERWDAVMSRSERVTPLARNGTPQEIAEAVGFLASTKASWITGENLMIDGGRQCMCSFVFGDNK